MSVAFPEVRVGDPVRHESLSVFPLFATTASPVEYLLADEGIGSGTLTVEEVSQAGSVPDLLVENKGDIRILFIEGEELVGAKQNRILNSSILIAARSKTKIPVSCVEAGRWGYKSRHFGSSGSHSPSKLRHFLKASVSDSLRTGRGHRSDQNKVWEEVARQQKSLGTDSGTSAMSDTFHAYEERVTEYPNDRMPCRWPHEFSRCIAQCCDRPPKGTGSNTHEDRSLPKAEGAALSVPLSAGVSVGSPRTLSGSFAAVYRWEHTRYQQPPKSDRSSSSWESNLTISALRRERTAKQVQNGSSLGAPAARHPFR